jgi:hypothetical protein
MTSPPRVSSPPRRQWNEAVADATAVVLMATVGVACTWPIYQDAWLLVTVGAAVAAATALTSAATRWHWSGIRMLSALAGAYLLLGIPMAAPQAAFDPQRWAAALLGVVAAPVTGWKDLLTLDLPLGTYRTTLASALLVFLLVPAAALWLAWRSRRHAAWAPATALLMPVFGILFGSSALRETVPPAPPGTLEALLAMAAVGIALAWQRRLGRRPAGTVTGTTSRRGQAVRGGAAVAMVVAAAVVATAVSPAAVADSARRVLRAGVEPTAAVAGALSPLTTYRSYFADAEYDRVQFRVKTGSDVDRVRLAALGEYDGVTARTAGPDGAALFERVPAALTAPPGTDVVAEVTIDGYQGIWVPSVGALRSIAFTGSGRTSLTDGFYYSPQLLTGIDVAGSGLADGAAYRLSATVPDSAGPGGLVPTRAGPALDPAVVPPEVREWMRAQQAGTGAAALRMLLDRLRARGFLSHSSTADASGLAYPWVAESPARTFAPSRPGHSTDRIAELFRALLDREGQVAARDDASLVAAVGDDEQFAVAAMMIADQLGFDSRVVVGARLTGSSSDTVPACEGGVCRGKNMSAWLEVQDAAGAWVPMDVTPQNAIPPRPDLVERRDPRNVTEVDPLRAPVVPPPEANPAGGSPPDPPAPVDADLSALWFGLRVAGIVLLALIVLLAPPIALVLIKAVRRRSRRRARPAASRIAAGWEEYVDAAVDHGAIGAGVLTRTELAAAHDPGGRTGAATLAVWADRAVFGANAPTSDDADAFWTLIDAERAAWDARAGWWGRLRARLSLRSLRRTLRAGGDAPGGPS